VSRILVADDNSNIQKMVALALKDEGIDVVAVGNGDAAMRKIPDLRPDLILADIFMPVRNGYEVCEFVKSDSRFMNTPVVLLVGAFDPLDEEETQRVRADGVLKKPFVPPDPLINMVKTLLAKSNGQKPAPVMTAPSAKPEPPPQVAPAAPPAARQSYSSNDKVAPPEQLAERETRTNSSPQQEPPAFVARAQKPAPEPANLDEPDEVTTAARDPNLGEPFWAAPAEPEESEEPEEQSATEPEDIIDLHSFGKDSSVERDDGPRFRPELASFDKGKLAAALAENEGATSEIETAVPQAANSRPATTDEDAVNQVEARSKSESASSAPAPDETTVEPFQFDPTLTFAASAETEEEPADALPTMVLPELPSVPMTQASAETDNAAALELQPLELPANDEAATLSWPAPADSMVDTPAAPLAPVEFHGEIQPADMDLKPLPNQDAVITAAAEAARMAFSELSTFVDSDPSTGNLNGNAAGTEMPPVPAHNPFEDRKQAEDGQRDSPFSVAHVEAAAATPEMIEALVNRVLERMQPQVMEVVNREVLRPAIEAMVRREMEKS